MIAYAFYFVNIMTLIPNRNSDTSNPAPPRQERLISPAVFDGLLPKTDRSNCPIRPYNSQRPDRLA